MAASFQTSRRVEFRDTDAAGIMHFAAILGFMEEAEHEFLRHVGLPLFRKVDGGQVSWPRVSVQADFASPARFEDVVDIHVQVERLGQRSVTYHFELKHDERLIAEGSMSSVCCFIGKGEMRGVDIPQDVARTLSAYLADAEPEQ